MSNIAMHNEECIWCDGTCFADFVLSEDTGKHYEVAVCEKCGTDYCDSETMDRILQDLREKIYGRKSR